MSSAQDVRERGVHKVVADDKSRKGDMKSEILKSIRTRYLSLNLTFSRSFLSGLLREWPSSIRAVAIRSGDC